MFVILRHATYLLFFIFLRSKRPFLFCKNTFLLTVIAKMDENMRALWNRIIFKTVKLLFLLTDACFLYTFMSAYLHSKNTFVLPWSFLDLVSQ